MSDNKGFTLIEVLIGIALSSIVIGIIFGLLGPLNRGIRQDQHRDGYKSEFNNKIEILERSLREGKRLTLWEVTEDFAEVRWINSSGLEQSMEWSDQKFLLNQKDLFAHYQLNQFQISCIPEDDCQSLTSSLLLFKLNFVYEDYSREVVVRWRP